MQGTTLIEGYRVEWIHQHRGRTVCRVSRRPMAMGKALRVAERMRARGHRAQIC